MRVRFPPNPPMNFCEGCNKIVPDSEVKQPFKNANADFPYRNDKKIHVYETCVNIFQAGPGMIGCCLVNETVWCGDVREPTDQEYFIYHTLEM